MALFRRKQALDYVPYGQIATRAWLFSQGLSPHTLDNWVKSDQLLPVAPGVYTRPDTRLTWGSVVLSLQQMGSDLCPGGITALNCQGLGHYVERGKQQTIHLYGEDHLPTWANRVLSDVRFVWHNERKLIQEECLPTLKKLVTELPPELILGLESIQASSPERAWFEVLLDVPGTISFEHADQLMQGLVNLSPRRLSWLLKCCNNVKVCRLFLWFAERHHHAWFEKMDTERFTMESGLLGSGKRVLSKGGKLNSKYLITVPAEMVNDEAYG